MTVQQTRHSQFYMAKPKVISTSLLICYNRETVQPKHAAKDDLTLSGQLSSMWSQVSVNLAFPRRSLLFWCGLDAIDADMAGCLTNAGIRLHKWAPCETCSGFNPGITVWCPPRSRLAELFGSHNTTLCYMRKHLRLLKGAKKITLRLYNEQGLAAVVWRGGVGDCRQ